MRARMSGIVAAVSMAVWALALEGCHDGSPGSGPEPRSGARGTSVSAGTAVPSRSPWTPRRVRGGYGWPERLTADPRGDIFVPFGQPGRVFRVLHRGGRATAVERVDVSLQALAGFSGGFLAYAWRGWGLGEPLRRHWLVIDGQGRVRPVAEELSKRSTLRPGDVVYRSPLRDQSFGFRPATGARFPFPVPVQHRLWQRDERGWLWSCPSRGSSRIIWWSSDGARSWHPTEYRLEGAAGPSSRWTIRCLVRGGRLVLIAFLDDNPAGFISWPLDGSAVLSGALTPFGPLRNPYAAALLADGRLVFGTNRKGLQTETAPGSNRFIFAPGPIRADSDPDPTRAGLAWTRGHWITLTNDGRHWNRINAFAD